MHEKNQYTKKQTKNKLCKKECLLFINMDQQKHTDCKD